MIAKYENIISEVIVEAILYLGMNASEINEWTHGRFYRKWNGKTPACFFITTSGKEIEIPVGFYIVKTDNDSFSAMRHMLFDDKYIIVK